MSGFVALVPCCNCVQPCQVMLLTCRWLIRDARWLFRDGWGRLSNCGQGRVCAHKQGRCQVLVARMLQTERGQGMLLT